MWDPFECHAADELAAATDGSERNMCFQCHQENMIHLDENYGTLVCSGCGTVNCNLVEKQSDQASALSEGSSINFYLPKSSLGTSIAGASRMKLRMVNDWWKWVYKEKSFFDDKKDIELKCNRIGLTQAVIDNSLNLYKRVSEAKHADGKYVIIRGTNRKAIRAAAVYYGARLQHQPRAPKEIADVFELEMAQMTKGCKRFLQLVDLSSLLKSNNKSEAQDYVQHICHRMVLDKHLSSKALDVVKNIQTLQLVTNHQPPAVAASTLLLVMEMYGSRPIREFKSSLSEILKVSEVTIGKTLKEIQPWIRMLTNTELIESIVAAETEDALHDP